jgi:structural maintenance of chromosome 2
LGSGDSGSGGGYLGQIADANARLTQVKTEETQANTQIKMKQKELSDAQAKLQSVSGEANEAKNRLAQLQRELGALTAKLAAIKWSEDAENNVERELETIKKELQGLSDRRDRLLQDPSLSGLSFNYPSPHANFPRDKVRGRLANLVNLPEENAHKAAALEAAAGGKLYQVVVDTSDIGKEVLNIGKKLGKRVTLIPLDKIRPNKLPAQKVGMAQQFSKKSGDITLALNDITYRTTNPSLTPAMEYAFGSTILCETAAQAKDVTFAPIVGCRTVTYDGDVYEPGGTLSGGAKSGGAGLLQKARSVVQVEDRISELQRRKAELEGASKPRTEWKESRTRIEEKSYEIQLLEERLQAGEAGRVRIMFVFPVLHREITPLRFRRWSTRGKARLQSFRRLCSL